MRFELPGYDVNYRDGSDHNTPAGKKIAELNSFLMKNGIRGGIACLDEKGQVVRRYTDRVVLEIDDSVSPEKLEKIKKMVSELLRVMGATESQIAGVFNDKNENEQRINNMGNYEMEKFHAMKKKIKSLIKTLDIIDEYSKKADELGIYVKKDFTFNEVYIKHGFDERKGRFVDFEDLRNKFMGYSYNLQDAVQKGEVSKKPFPMKNMEDYETEKFGSLKSKLQHLVNYMDTISKYINKADELGIYVKKDFTFDEVYRTGGFDYTHGQVDFADFKDKVWKYSYDLKNKVDDKIKTKEE